MQRKTHKRKILITALLLVAVLAATAFTYAWFTAQAQGNTVVDMGNLKVETTLNADEDDVLLEPGISYDFSGVITNQGTVGAAVLVDYSTPVQVTIKSDSDGNPLDEDDYYTITADPALIKVAFDEDAMGWGANSDFSKMFQWFKVNDEPGKYLLLIIGQNVSTTELTYTLELDGPGLGNLYQNAEMKIAGGWKATQALDAAIEDVLGLVVYGPNADVTPMNTDNFTPFSLGAPTQAQVLAAFEEILSR